MPNTKINLDALERALTGSAMGLTFRECQSLIKYARELEAENLELCGVAQAADAQRRELESASQHGGGEALPTTGQLTALLPGVYYMDPPDGGSVTLLEQLQRMASDAARYLLLRRKVCIVDSKFHIINIEPTYIGPDAGIELDASIDFALRAAPSAGNGGAEGDGNGR